MKYFKYLLLAISAMSMATSCTDEGPAEIISVSSVTTRITELTPSNAVLEINVPDDAFRDIDVIVTDEAGYTHIYYTDKVDDGSNNASYVAYIKNNSAYSPDGNYDYDYELIAPGKTFTYTVTGEVRGEGWHLSNYIEIASGTFTLPTVEEYFKENFGEMTMQASVVTNNSAMLTIVLPEKVYLTQRPSLIYASSSDFSDANTIEYTGDFYDYTKLKSFSFTLENLAEATTYHVKLNGSFEIASSQDYQYIENAEATPTPATFKTMSKGEVITEARCIASYTQSLDVMAQGSLYLPDIWTFYKEYSNDPINCTVIYSTDPDFTSYSVVPETKGGSDSYHWFLENLEPETTYYLALKGDFYCSRIDYVLKDYIMPANQAVTTAKPNQVETIDGHACVDLGLSVKWATEDLSNGNSYTFTWANGNPETKDIAGTEYDWATSLWGAAYRTPTVEQWKELNDNCERITLYGSNSDHPKFNVRRSSNGNYILTPDPKTYWTSTASTEYRGYAQYIEFYRGGYDNNKASVTSKYRIRPVTTK